MDEARITIMRFELKNMVQSPTILLVGKRGSGKSYIVRELLYHFRDMPAGTIISPTDKVNGFYGKFFPDLFVHFEISMKLLQDIMLRQFQIVTKNTEKNKEGKRIDMRAVVVMDDCLADAKKWKNDTSIKDIMMNGRHYHLTYILTLQSPLGIGPDLRTNFDYYILTKDDNVINKKKIWENYVSIISNFKKFLAIFDMCTANFKCVIVDNRSPKSFINQKVFWFKSPNRDFLFGSKRFIEKHKEFYNENFLADTMRDKINGGGHVSLM